MGNGLLRLPVRYLQERRARTLLTATGIFLGVALFVGALTLSASLTGALDEWARDAQGLSDVVLTPAGRAANAATPFSGVGSGYVDASELERVAQLPDVADVVGVIGLASAVTADSGRTTEVQINRGPPVALVGAKLDDATLMYNLELVGGRMPRPGEAEVLVSPSLARDLEVGVGDDVRVATPTGDRAMVVVGALAARGAGRLAGIALTSLETAQDVAGKPSQVSHIAVRLADGTDPEAWKLQHEAAIQPLTVSSAGADIRHALAQLGAMGGALTVLASGVVLVAGFLVYLTLSTAIVERVRLYGVLQALGATRQQVRNLVLTEAVVMGLVASFAGCFLGVVVARVLLRISARFMEGITTSLMISPVTLAAGVVMGALITSFGALIPARHAARMDPITAMRADFDVDNRPPRIWAAGVAILVLGVAALGFGRSDTALLLGLPSMLLGAILLLPVIVRPLARVLGSLTARVARGTGHVAVLHLVKERTRSAYTLALVMSVVALALATAAARHSFTTTLDRELDATYGFDLSLIGASGFSEDFVTALEQVPGVAATVPITETAAAFSVGTSDEAAQVRVVDARYFDVAGFHWVDGNDDVGRSILSTTGRMIFPQATAERSHVKVGDVVPFQTDHGEVGIEVGAIATISNALPTLFIGRESGRDLFGATTPDQILLDVDDSATPSEVSGRIETALGDQATFIVGTVNDLKTDIKQQIAAGVNGFQLLLVFAGVVGLLGLANTLAVSAVQRYREIGVLRAVGARRSQIATASLVEALTLCLVAIVVAIPIGAFIAAPLVDGVIRAVGDLTVDYSFPWAAVPAIGAVTLAVAALASVVPARRASSSDIDVALRFD